MHACWRAERAPLVIQLACFSHVFAFWPRGCPSAGRAEEARPVIFVPGEWMNFAFSLGSLLFDLSEQPI